MLIAARSMARPRGGPAPLTPALYAQQGLAACLDAEYNNGRSLAARLTGAYQGGTWLDWATGAAATGPNAGAWGAKWLEKVSTVIQAQIQPASAWALPLTLEVCLSAAGVSAASAFAARVGSSNLANGTVLAVGLYHPTNADYGKYALVAQKSALKVAGAGAQPFAGTLAVTGRVDGSTVYAEVFLGGSSAGTASAAAPSALASGTRLYLGYQYAAGTRIHCARLYARALSAAEIAANAEIDRQRFFAGT